MSIYLTLSQGTKLTVFTWNSGSGILAKNNICQTPVLKNGQHSPLPCIVIFPRELLVAFQHDVRQHSHSYKERAKKITKSEKQKHNTYASPLKMAAQE